MILWSWAMFLLILDSYGDMIKHIFGQKKKYHFTIFLELIFGRKCRSQVTYLQIATNVSRLKLPYLYNRELLLTFALTAENELGKNKK